MQQQYAIDDALCVSTFASRDLPSRMPEINSHGTAEQARQHYPSCPASHHVITDTCFRSDESADSNRLVPYNGIVICGLVGPI